jgi:hypothetical protein
MLSAHQLNSSEPFALVKIDTGDAIGHCHVQEEFLLKQWNQQNHMSTVIVKRIMDK